MAFCTYRKKKDNVKSFYNREIKNDATQHKMRKHTLHFLFQKKRMCKISDYASRRKQNIEERGQTSDT